MSIPSGLIRYTPRREVLFRVPCKMAINMGKGMDKGLSSCKEGKKIVAERSGNVARIG
jgi:hypothetical protein